MAVCDKIFNLYSQPPYSGQFIFVPPRRQISPSDAAVFDCARDHKRHPRETKGADFNVTTITGNACAPASKCCP
jgi:hypothetical protein